MLEYIKILSKKWIVYLMLLPAIYDGSDAYFNFETKLPNTLAILMALVFFFIASYRVWKDENDEKLKLDLLFLGNIIELSQEAEKLLKEATLDKNKTIFFFKEHDIFVLQTNDIRFTKHNDARTIAKWEEALKELVDYKLVDTDEESHYKVRHKGYKYIDSKSI